MTPEKSKADVLLRDRSTSAANRWLIPAFVVSAVVLIGMFLPWVDGLDFGSFFIAGGSVNGWNLRSLPIPTLIGVTLCIGLGFVKARTPRALTLAAMLCCCVASLIPIVDLAVFVMGSSGKGMYGTFLITSEAPLAGLWVTLLGVIGMILFGVAIGVKTILPEYRRSAGSG